MWNRRLLVLAAALALYGCASTGQRITLGIKDAELSVEVARTPEEQQRGLMNRTSLGDRQGMLFVFEQDEHLSFWMKNTPLPLSIAFISREGKILEIVDMEPFSLKQIKSRNYCRYALEVKQGVFQDIGARIGDMIRFPEGFG